jgi:NTP pyrophosphatase (non-canonical NTP hydrolase)
MPDLTLRELQEDQRPWCERNFPDAQPWHPLLGAVEELGELCHHHLKAEQGMRNTENHQDGKVDAVADVIIYLADYCTRNGIDLQDALNRTWAKVGLRDWRKNPNTAHLEAERRAGRLDFLLKPQEPRLAPEAPPTEIWQEDDGHAD